MSPKTSISQLEDHLGYWLRRVSNHVSHAFQAKLAERDVTVAEWVALRVLYDTQAISSSILAEQMGMTRGAVSKLVDRLVQKNLVTRAYSEQDRRFQSISLTKTGKALVPELAKIADSNDNFYFSSLSEKQRNELLKILKSLTEHHELKTIPIE